MMWACIDQVKRSWTTRKRSGRVPAWWGWVWPLEIGSGRVLTWWGGAWPLGMWVGVSWPGVGERDQLECEWACPDLVRGSVTTGNVSGRVLTWCGGAWPLGMWVGVSWPGVGERDHYKCEWACPDLVWGSVTTPSHPPPLPGCCLQIPWELLPCRTSWTEQMMIFWSDLRIQI